MRTFEYAVAKNENGIHEAVKRGYHIKAGGVDLLDLMKERIHPADKYVSITGVDSLHGIDVQDDRLHIGALVTLAELAGNELVAEHAHVLADSIRHAATPQVRAAATVAGNLAQRPRCWYFRSAAHKCLKKGGGQCFAVDGENTYHAMYGPGPCHITHPSNLAPALVALRGTVHTKGPEGERDIPAAEFFVTPDRSMYAENVLREGELIRALSVPLKSATKKSAYIDLKEKQTYDWPLAAATVAHDGEKWHVILAHVAPVPWRATAAEEVLGGATSIDNELAEKAADAALQDASPMSRNAWRLKLVRAAVRRALLLADGKEFA